MLPLLLLFCNSSQNSVAGSKQKSPDAQSGTLEKMIVASGSVAMDVDLNRLNGVNSATAKRETLRFAVAADSFFPVLVFNDVLRGAEPGSIALIPQNSATLPAALSASLSVQCQRKHEFHVFARWLYGAIETCHLCLDRSNHQ